MAPWIAVTGLLAKSGRLAANEPAQRVLPGAERERAKRADAICIAAATRLAKAPKRDCITDGMAIQFARARYISRASGGNAVRSAAYNAREAIDGGAHRRAVLLPPPRRARAPRGAAARGRRRAIRRQRGAVERGGGGGAAQGRAGRPRDRAGAAGRPRADRRGPGRPGALVRRAALRRQGSGGAARRARAAQGSGEGEGASRGHRRRTGTRIC